MEDLMATLMDILKKVFEYLKDFLAKYLNSTEEPTTTVAAE